MNQGVTLVTGASRGIGRAIADHLMASGQTVIGIATKQPADPFAGELFLADFSDQDATADVLAEISSTHQVTRLVNNAGVSPSGSAIEDLTAAELEAVMAVNVRAAMQCTQACLPAMLAAGFGRIVNMGSRASLGRAKRSAYGMSKAALIAMTRTLALEHAGDGITVNCVAPGPVETDMFLANHPIGSEAYKAWMANVPVGRMAQPDEIATACAYFLSDKAGFTTGQVLYVCGGLSVGSMAS